MKRKSVRSAVESAFLTASTGEATLDEPGFRSLLARRIERLDVDAARSEVGRFLVDPAAVGVWSREFFLAFSERVSVSTQNPPSIAVGRKL